MLPQKYNYKEAEKRWQAAWEEQGVYHWDESASRENSYVIDTPPPTVSGLLHMGHIFSYTQADFVARYQRMKGKTVFYPMGFDDNGLPTERLVEKSKKIRATDMSREEFIEVCEGVAEEARVEFRRLFESVALSVDWNQEYHTISEDSRKISQLSFLDLFKKQRVYRRLQPMLWDPVDQTAIAQAEVEDKERPSKMNYVRFAVEGTEEDITIATTRPELLVACVAVFYHPDDERYNHLAGKNAITAGFGVKVPLLPDENVKLEKGSGLVMCCTFGDETDILWWQSHNLSTRLMLNKYGKIAFQSTDNQEIIFSEGAAPITSENSISIERACSWAQEITNLKVNAAKEKMLELLEADGFLIKQEEIMQTVKCAERSGAPLEILPTFQWFVKILDQKDELKAKAEQCNWHPEFMKIRVDQWIDGLNWDWCISRQRYFGVPFPIWYSKREGEEGKILVAEADQLPVNPLVDTPKGYQLDEVTPEMDVMDTWATSSVSPQLSSKAINQEFAVDYDRHQKLFPADLRPQAHEIIRTWAFYTIVKAHLHEGTIPWKNLMISGWCLASDKTKMSKSKGNVVTPVDLIEEKSADVVRFWASTSKLGSDTAYSEDVLKIGKKLVNKLFNATKFAAIHLEKLQSKPVSAAADIGKNIITEDLDLWVLSKLSIAVRNASENFEKYEYSNARSAVEDFFWNDFCDNYLELVKGRVYGEKEGTTEAQQLSAVHTIYHCLQTLLKLFAPFVPHVTEELYQAIFDAEQSIHQRGSWPKQADYSEDAKALATGEHAVAILDLVRKAKAQENVSVKWPLHSIVVEGADISLSSLEQDLQNVTNADKIEKGSLASESGFITISNDDETLKIAVSFYDENEQVASN